MLIQDVLKYRNIHFFICIYLEKQRAGARTYLGISAPYIEETYIKN